jgi:preprotein translocase subunit SecG
MILLVLLFFATSVATILIIDKSYNNFLPGTTFAQSSENVTSPPNKTQEWISQKDDVKILFTYQPERPVIDTFTKLEFSVINLTNNENLEDFDARVVVTNGQRLFKFENISVPNGNFSVEYLFPEDGTHQIITRVDKDATVQVLASFSVFVPHQAPPSLLNPFPNASESEIESITRFLTIVISFAIIIVVVIMLRKGKGRKNRKRQRLGYYE